MKILFEIDTFRIPVFVGHKPTQQLLIEKAIMSVASIKEISGVSWSSRDSSSTLSTHPHSVFLNQSQQTKQGQEGGFPSPNCPEVSCCWSRGHIMPSTWNSFPPTPTLTLLCTEHVLVFPSIACPSYSSFRANLRSYFSQKAFLESSPSQTGSLSPLWGALTCVLTPL